MSDELFEVGIEIARAGARGFLTTLHEGRPRTRMVEPLITDDATIWIATGPATRKAADITMNTQVTYAVEERGSDAAATFYGDAELIADLAERVARWNEATALNGGDESRLRRIFPDGPTGDDYVLIRIRPRAVEVIDFGRGIHPAPVGLRVARAGRDR